MSAPLAVDDAPKQLISHVIEAVQRQSAGTVVTCSVAAIGLVAIGDYITGEEISLTIFYLLPVLLAATKGTGVGLRIAILCAVAWFAADVTGRSEPYETVLVPIWNACMRLLVFWLVVGLAGALTRSLAHEQELSRRDALTGLANSRGFYEAAETECRRMVRTRQPLTLLYVDIDDFKLVNDSLGHAAGDHVLVETARLLTEGVRDIDLAGRLGGDEFAVLLPETDAVGASQVVERLHDRLTLEARAQGWPIGFSAGVVTFTSPVANADQLVSAGDALMYEAKHSGKRTIKSAAF